MRKIIRRTKTTIWRLLKQALEFLGHLTLGDLLIIMTWLCGTLLLLSDNDTKVVCGVVLIGIGVAGMIFTRRG